MLSHSEICNVAEFVGLSHPDIQMVGLFGSYARGEQRADSDVDLLVLGKHGLLDS